MGWSATQYVKFEQERNRPIRDLLSVLPSGGVASAIDLGCGPGNSTELLRERYRGSTIVGIDSSPDMVAAARRRMPDVRFDIADIALWNGDERFDVILANASLQWVPNHERLLPALVDRLTIGGHLAIQIPDNWDEPAHRLMRALATGDRWNGKLVGSERAHDNRHPAAWYHDLIRPLVGSLDIWRTTYFHELLDAAAVVEWFKGSALRPILTRLGSEEREAFLAAYSGAIADAYPRSASGTILLPFPRLFVMARR